MFKFTKAMARVSKKDEVLETQDCGCGPRRNQASTGLSCCGPKSFGSEHDPVQEPTTECASCDTPVENSCDGSSSEKLQTSTELDDDEPPTGFCCG